MWTIASAAAAAGPAAPPPPATTAKPPTKAECVHANETAQDLRRTGQLHEARADLATCLQTSCPRPVREDCAQRLADIEAAMPTAVFVVKDAAGNDLSEVRVTLDGRPLLDRLQGGALPINPGEHRFVFDAEGFRKAETTIVLREGDKKRRVLAFLDPVASPAPAAETAPAPAPAAALASVPPPRSGGADAGKGQRALGMVLSGMGLAGLAVGSVFGVLSKVTYDHSQSECVMNNCPQAAMDDWQAAHRQATVADVAFAAGGVLLGTGVVVLLTAPAKNTFLGIGPAVVDEGGGIGLRGTW